MSISSCRRPRWRRNYIDIPEIASLDLPAAEVDAIARNSTEVTVNPGERLCRQGEAPREMYLLLEGQADVLRSGELVAHVGANEVVGEAALVQRDLYRSADVYATTPGRALVFTPREWWTVAEAAPTFAAQVCATACRRRASTGAGTPED